MFATPFLAFAFAVMQLQGPRTIEGISNGDFETVWQGNGTTVNGGCGV